MIDEYKKYNKERLRLLKRAKLTFLENKLQLQNKNGANTQEIHQTMKDISQVQSEIKNLQK